ncbi:MAG TPA: NfeD family protein [Candidatus Rifleibacterium sp.]|nr:NfeD family protein [Candidatus Rifleibacterium sp.]HPT46916.1 NfeD family protein [Candidatus Rifleibacterium sp.]
MRFRFLFVLLMFVLAALPVTAGVDAGELLPEKAIESAASSAVSPGISEQAEKPAWGMMVAVLMVAGLLFLFLEIAVIPGFGVTGIIGLLLLGGGILAAYLKLSSGMAVFATFAGLAGVTLLLLWFFFIFPKTSLGKNFVLSTESSVSEGFVAVEDLQRYLGKEGVATTMLRPSGIARIDGERLDVITDGEFVEKGAKVRVVKALAGRIIVSEVPEGTAN